MSCSESNSELGVSDLEPSECSKVIQDVWLFLDNEMDAEQRAQIQHHLDGCSPCLEESDIGEKLKALLHKKCGGDVAPELLRAKLVAALQSQPAAQ
ncbi:mycothiol system anti-sigma-R factor [Nakamurella silvestris]|nr:mycothiol system anti-sigma-R factor [Nakamurella silvestris]